jgi:hypothetical protein
MRMADFSQEPQPSSIADSPLLWLCVFLGMAIAAVAVIGPKYERRQAAIEQRFLMREHLHRIQSAGELDAVPQFEPRGGLIHGWRPLLVLLGLLFAAAYGGLLWQRRVARKLHEPKVERSP